MVALNSTRFRGTGRAATFLRTYLVASALALVGGFVLYTQWILNRLETNNRALVEPLARLAAYLPAISDHEASRLIQAIVTGVAEHGRIRFIITDAEKRPIVARGCGRHLDEKIRRDQPLSAAETVRIRRLIAHMESARRQIPVEFVTGERRVIGRIYYGDVDASALPAMPFVFADVRDQPIAWRIYHGWMTAESHRDEIGEALALMRDASRHRRVRELQVDPPIQSGTFYFELQPLRALQWMPALQLLFVGGVVWGGILLYRRAQVDEQAAIWAGLAKESAHQLGTPVSSLMGWLNLAQETDALSEEMPNIHAEMERDVGRLQRVVARFAQVGQVPQKSAVNANDAVAEAAAYFRQRLPTHAKRTEIVEQSAVVPEIAANAELIQWVVENLIRNALDAIESSDATAGRVVLSTRYDAPNECVIIRVEDNGGGIARSLQRRIFAPGFTTKKHGWGVGLTLVKRIVESYHNGTVRLMTSSSAGSTFEIRLPRSPRERRQSDA